MLGLLLATMFQAQAGVPEIPPGYGLKTPKVEQMNRLLFEGLSPHVNRGAALVECHVATGGRLIDCQAIQESPPGLGVGRAVVRVVRTFKLVPTGDDVPPADGGMVRVPIHFALPR